GSTPNGVPAFSRGLPRYSGATPGSDRIARPDPEGVAASRKTPTIRRRAGTPSGQGFQGVIFSFVVGRAVWRSRCGRRCGSALAWGAVSWGRVWIWDSVPDRRGGPVEAVVWRTGRWSSW